MTDTPLSKFDVNAIQPDLLKGLHFILEIGKLKSVIRQTYLTKQDRKENSAEHSWHMILMAMMFAPHANDNIDLNKVIKMLAVHDLGEIDGGDTYLYAANRGENEHEKKCMDRICAMAPPAQAQEIMDLWLEFEKSESAEAKFAQAIDRFQPFLYTLQNGGHSWSENNIPYDLVIEKNKHIADGSAELWKTYQDLIHQAHKIGYFAHSDDSESDHDISNKTTETC